MTDKEGNHAMNPQPPRLIPMTNLYAYIALIATIGLVGSLAKCRVTISWGENRPTEQTQTQPAQRP